MDDSTIFLRDRPRNTELEGQFKKKPGTIVAESSHNGDKERTQVLSKQDIAKKESASAQKLAQKEETAIHWGEKLQH